MKSISLDREVFQGGILAMDLLNALELPYDRPLDVTGPYQPQCLLSFLRQRFRLDRQFHRVQMFCQASMIIDMALADAPAIEPLRDDGISETQPKEFRILEVP
jgi:hypothetical protein